MLREWYFTSLGVIDPLDDETKETYYLSKVANAYAFGHLNIVPWTNWLGDLYVRAKASIHSGHSPTELEYGPPRLYERRAVGPVIDYYFSDGRLRRLDYLFGAADVESLAQREEDSPAQQIEFGLKDIIRTIDLDQNDQIRGPMNGVFLLIGGPGVGKTTVALHRVPYLINEQIPFEKRRSGEDQAEDYFFRQDRTLVLVWKNHLVPYLRQCLIELGMERFPVENVQHIDDWIQFELKKYVKVGPGRGNHRFVRNEDDECYDHKLHFTEADLAEFLASAHPSAKESAEEVALRIQDLRESLESRGQSLPFAFRQEFHQFTVAGIEELCDQLRSRVPEYEPGELDDEDDLLDGEDSASSRSDPLQIIAALRRRELGRLCRYPEILQRFYSSEIARIRLLTKHDAEDVDGFVDSVREQSRRRVLSPADQYLLLWMIDQLTTGSLLKNVRVRAMERFTHVLVDEAQYYEPLVLRFLARVAQVPRGVLTIVGDLEQRISAKGGLLSWATAGLEVPPERIQKLVTNYRWSKQVFEFLELYKNAAGIEEQLRRPRTWFSGAGRRPEIWKVAENNSELDFVAERIAEIKDPSSSSSKWTVAVVVPEPVQAQARTMLVDVLHSFGVHARWATGEDVKESVDRVIVTDFDSIVGLEFDAVFVIGCEHALLGTRESVRAMWVALTRARRFICISCCKPVKVFEQPEFASYSQHAGSSDELHDARNGKRDSHWDRRI